MKKEGERYTVAVDFDGVLHSYTSPWVNEHTIPDPPVPGAMQWLREILMHFEVVIHTTRGRTPEGRGAVMGWLLTHWPDASGPRPGMISVTHEKPAALIYIDDRAWRFEGTFPTREQIHAARPWNKPAIAAE